MCRMFFAVSILHSLHTRSCETSKSSSWIFERCLSGKCLQDYNLYWTASITLIKCQFGVGINGTIVLLLKLYSRFVHVLESVSEYGEQPVL